ncbi:MAG TPA: radical SAM protein [Candidatus Olsenella avicola]|nr:radical SAM protein [Candidatus Olsenella avicola]
MKYISFLIKPASSACDMRCSYCFYRDVADHRAHAVRERMSAETVRALVDRALALGDDAQVTFAFQGGEPTLAGLDFFRDFTGYVDERRTNQNVSYALQTNAHTITPEWAEFFREHAFLVGVSVDAYRELHDGLRKDIALGPTHARVMESVRMLCEAGVDFNVLTVLSAQLARHPQRVFKFYQREKIDYVQLIPCLAGFDGEGAEYALTPRAFFSFYRAFFDLWLREVQAGHVISVGLFDNVMQLSLGQYPQACGMLGRCAPQFVVESNGDVYPCDFYALDEYRCGNVREDSLEDMASCEAMRTFLAEPRRPCAACADCPFEGICHRNCKRLNASYYDDEYCGYRAFLEHAYEPLARVARMLVSRGR